jgi:phosphate transport system substrate-binding protein
MTKWLLLAAAVIALGVALSVGWGGDRGRALNVVGSTSIQPFAEMLAQAYKKSHPGQYVDVQGGGSTAGLQAADNGLADVGTCSRELKPEEAGLFRPFVIAYDGLAIVVHPTNPVEGLTLHEIQRIFAGEITHWREVGGEDRPIRLVTREEGSGTREAFTKLVMHKVRISRKALTQPSNGAVKELVKHDPSALGYMSLGLVQGELKILKVGGVSATHPEVVAKRYPLVRPFLFVTKGAPKPAAQAFLDYVFSEPGQALLEKEGLVRAK